MNSLHDDKVDQLLTRLDELVRWRPGAKGQYQDLHSAVARLKGSANHIILGRRGSGKTRLLDELKHAVEGENTIVVTIGAEDFKELTYPDILIQILRSFLKEFQAILGHRPRLFSRHWWLNLKGAVVHPILWAERKGSTRSTKADVRKLLSELDLMLGESEELDAEYFRTTGSSSRQVESGGASAETTGFNTQVSATEETATSESLQRKLSQREVKRIKVERLLSDFKALLTSVCSHLGSRIILAVDDFYFIRRPDQPQVVDYVHRICKDTNAYLKIATIKHRSELFAHASVSRGVVPGHEIQPIALELPLGQYDSITSFLKSIWRAICSEVGIHESEALFMGGGFEQAVLASGGVPRDFLGIAKASILIAKERDERAVGKRRINEAARQYTEETKFPELRVDVGEDEELVYLLLYDIVRFARDEKRKNCFHIDIDRLAKLPEVHTLLDALVDSRLLHLITDNTSNARRAGRFAAYLLDVGLYGHPERRGENAVEEVQFWVRDAAGRLKNLDRSPVYPLRSFDELRGKAADLASKNMSVKKSLLPSEEPQEPATSQLDLVFPASGNGNVSELEGPPGQT